MGNKKSKARGLYKETFTFKDKRYYVYGKTKQELAEKVTQKRQMLESGELTRKNPKLDEYYEYFTEVKRQELRESTIRNQIHRYKLIANVEMQTGDTFGHLRIRDIKRYDIEYVRQRLLEQGKKPECINPYFDHLIHVFNSAVIDGLIDKNPCQKLKHLKREEKPIGETKHRFITAEEREKFYKAAEERNSYYLNHFKVMELTGMRFGELTALYPVDIENGFIHITKSVTRTEDGQYIVGQYTKTESGKRDFPLMDDNGNEFKELTDILKRQIRQNVAMFNDIGGLIFRSFDGEIARDYTVNREIERICKAANIEKFTCHAFRSTFITDFLEENPGRYEECAQLVGHKNAKEIIETYHKPEPKRRMAALGKLMKRRIS